VGLPIPDARVRRTGPALEEYEPCEKGYTLAGFRAAVLKLWGDDGLRTVAAALDDDARREAGVTGPIASWIPERHVAAWCFAVWEHLARRERPWIERFLQVHVDHGFGILRRTLLQLASPRTLLERAPRLWAEDHTHGDLEVTFTGESAADIRVRNHPFTGIIHARAALAEVFRYDISLTRAGNVTEMHRLESPGVLIVSLAWR
jgi:hypothetical protein